VSKTKYCSSLKVKDLSAPNLWAGLLATPPGFGCAYGQTSQNLEAVNAGLQWKVFIASQGHWKWPDNVSHVTAENVVFLQRVSDQLLPLIHSIFCTKRDYIGVTQF